MMGNQRTEDRNGIYPKIMIQALTLRELEDPHTIKPDEGKSENR